MSNPKISITITKDGSDRGASISFECVDDAPTFRITMVSVDGDKETLETKDYVQASHFFAKKSVDATLLVTPREHRQKLVDDVLAELLGDEEATCGRPAQHRWMVN